MMVVQCLDIQVIARHAADRIDSSRERGGGFELVAEGCHP